MLLWELVGRPDESVRPGVKRTEREMAELWDELDGDARKAHQAMVRLTAAGAQSVAMLRQRVHPAPGQSLNAKEIDQLLSDLDSDAFEVREKASRALETAGKSARPALLKALAAQPSAEKKRRVQDLLDALSRPGSGAGNGSTCAALEVLERLGTPDAMKLLQELARGNPDAPLTIEANRVLRRLTRQP